MPNGTAVDVKSVGTTAYQMSKSFEHVHAFEINPKIYECMNYNLEKRSVDNITTYPVGLGAREETVSIKTTNKSFSTHVNPSQREGNIPVKPLDFFNLENVDFIKIDAEGYESQSQGGYKTIERCNPLYFMNVKTSMLRFTC